MLSQVIAERVKCVQCNSTEKGLLVFCTWFSLDFASCAFSSDDFDLYPFVVINLSCDYTPSPMSTPRNHQAWAWGPVVQLEREYSVLPLRRDLQRDSSPTFVLKMKKLRRRDIKW